MLEFTADSLAKFDADLAAWEAKTTKRITEVYRGLSIALFNFAVWETPQWTGSAAASWNIRAGAPSDDVELSLKASNTSERGSLSGKRNLPRHRYGSPVAQKGDPRAVMVAISRNAGYVGAINNPWVPVFITNAARDLSGDSYAGMLEANPNNYLRAVNEPGHMVARGVAKASAKFAMISPSDEASLRFLKLGDQINAGIRE